MSSFQDWKVHIRKMLKFSDETLNLATLRAHIGDGAEKKTILKRIQNCSSVDGALETLEKFYGTFSIIQPKLKKKLEELPDNPILMETESKNIEEILDYIMKMKKHNMSDKYVDADFINHFQHKLSTDRKKALADNDIETCDEFETSLALTRF